MPCSDSSTSMTIFLDNDENFLKFEYAKITCGREIAGGTGLSDYLKGKSLTDIITIPFIDVTQSLKVVEEEAQFILYLEWDALRCALALYLGEEDPTIDSDRCKITAISQNSDNTEVALVILPPKEMPKILPCSLGDK